MASTLNSVQIIGNLGRDPEMRYTPSGQAVTQFSAATSRSWKPQGSEEWSEETEWHRVVVWGSAAEQAAEKLRKGAKVFVQGRLQTRSWDDKTTGVKRYSTEIIAERLVFLEKAAGGANRQTDEYIDAQAAAGQRGTRSDAAPEPSGQAPVVDTSFDDLPF